MGDVLFHKLGKISFFSSIATIQTSSVLIHNHSHTVLKMLKTAKHQTHPNCETEEVFFPGQTLKTETNQHLIILLHTVEFQLGLTLLRCAYISDGEFRVSAALSTVRSGHA